MLKKLIDLFKNTEKVAKVDWILFFVISIILFVSFIYWDLFATVTHANNFTTVIRQLKFMDFYKFNYLFEVKGVQTMVCYDLPIYIFFMIWNFPLWILEHLFKIDILNNILCILWMKTLLISFLIGCSLIIQKICQEIKINKQYIKWIMLIFLSSPLIFSSLFIMTQYDIIALFFILLGIYYYIKKDYKKFLLFFAIAIPLKLFALFVFIPLVLLIEKRITRDIIYFILGGSILFISKFISMFMPYYKESTAVFNDDMIGILLNTSIFKINFGMASLFIAVYIAICIFCYMKELKTKEEINKYAIYIPFITYGFLFLLVSCNPYWLLYTTPFFAIMLFQNGKNYKTNLILDIFYSGSTILIQSCVFFWCYKAMQIDNLVIPAIFGKRTLEAMNYKNVYEVLSVFNIDKYMPILFAINLTTMLAMIIINFPQKNSPDQKIKIERSLVWLRMLIIVPFALVMVLCYYS